MKNRSLLMIPGPIEFEPAVLSAVGAPSDSHVSAGFIEVFGQALERMRQVFLCAEGQPLVLAGSGARRRRTGRTAWPRSSSSRRTSNADEMRAMLRKSIRTCLVAAVVIVAAVTGWLVRELAAPAVGSAGAKGVFFEVPKGLSARGVVGRLREEGLVRSAWPLRLACRIYYPGQRFKAGEYFFAAPLPAKEALFTIFGGRIYLQPVTVPEGLTEQEIVDLLKPGDAAGAAAFRQAFRNTAQIADLDPRAQDLEGYLFPDTYDLPRRAPASDLVEAMVGGLPPRFRRVPPRAGRRARPERARCRHLGLAHRGGNRAARGTAARLGRVPQPAQDWNEARLRPDRRLCAQAGGPLHGATALPRPQARFALQYLPPCRPSAGTDLESGGLEH